jgi:ariadne-1
MEYEYNDESDDSDRDRVGAAEAKMGFDDDADTAGGLAPPNLVRTDSYKIYTLKMLRARMHKAVGEAAELMGWTRPQAALMLRHFKWNSYKLQEQWFDSSARVIASVGYDPERPPASTPPAGQEIECPSCLDEVDARETRALTCGHRLCRTCWKDYCAVALDEGKSCIYQRCPEHECPFAMTDDVWEANLGPERLERFRRYVLRSFADECRDIAWCTAPRCDLLSFLPGGGPHDIHCPCGNMYCFKCKEEAHRPALCDQVSRWQLKNSAESENVTWIMANTKKCPKCHKPIEKNQGCNHMTCRVAAGGCGYEFCWMCLGEWKDHGTGTGGYYRCNRYEQLKKDGKLDQLEAKRDMAKHELERYMHYFERYMNHRRARTFGQRSLADIEKKMERLLHEKGYNISEVLFLKEAAQQVIESRRILQWTYVFGYYLDTGQEKDLFEHMQEKLESNTEALHELVEKPLDDFLAPELKDRGPFLDHRTKITNFARVSKKFRVNLINGIDNGLTSAHEFASPNK